MCHVVICHIIISIHYFLFKHSGFFCRVIFLNYQTGRIGAWVVAIGVVVSDCLVYCFAMLPSLFTLSFVDKEDIEYG